MGWAEVGDGVWVRRGGAFDVTSAVVTGQEAALLVDTGAGPQEAAALGAALAELDVPPVAHVVNTHAHGDHCFGNATLATRATVWGQRGCAAQLRVRGEHQRDHLLALLEATSPAAADVRAAAIAPPTALVDTETTIDLGGRTVVLRHLGPGHTDHDLVVHVPDAALVCAGDLVEQAGPPTFDHALPRAWPATLARLLALDPEVVVPGHGDPVDAAFVSAQRQAIARTVVLAEQVATGRLSQARAVAAAPLPAATVRAVTARLGELDGP